MFLLWEKDKCENPVTEHWEFAATWSWKLIRALQRYQVQAYRVYQTGQSYLTGNAGKGFREFNRATGGLAVLGYCFVVSHFEGKNKKMETRQEVNYVIKELITVVCVCRWMERHYYICAGAETLIHSPVALSTTSLWEPYHSPLGVCWYMTMTFIFHSHSISRWWMGWRLPAATLGLVFCLTNCCSAAPTNLPDWEYVPICRTVSTSTLSPLL